MKSSNVLSHSTQFNIGLIVFLTLLLSGCGGGGSGGGGGGSPTQFTVGGSVSGLIGTVVLQNNGGDDLTISLDGPFSFSTPIADGAVYVVTIKTKPTGQTCTASNNNGVIAGTNVTNVSIVCEPNIVNLDPTFGTGGKVITGIGTTGPGIDRADAVLIQGDGKIVAAGQAVGQPVNNAYYFDFALVRYNTDGSLDNSFGTAGKVTTAVGVSSSPNDIAIQGDGKIVVAGSSWNGSNTHFALARYNPDGSLDTNFGAGGIVITAIGGDSDYASAVALQGDGKLVVAGSSWNGNYFDFALARYNSDGSLDITFGTGGFVTTGVRNSSDANAYAMKIQSDGKIVLAGGSGAPWSGVNFCYAIARFNADGSLDNTFGTGGKIITEVGSGSYVSGIAIQQNGKITAAGSATVNNNDEFALVRYNPDGSLDTGFGIGGQVTTGVGNGTASASSMAIQVDGKIVLAGTATFNSNSDFALARYYSDGSMDSVFGTDGKIVTDFGSANDIAADLAIQSDGKIVVVGGTSLAGNDDFVVARYLP